MARRIILKEGGLNGGEAPSGFKFLGLSGESLGLKTGDEINPVAESGGKVTLSDVLANGNETGGINIQLTDGTRLYTEDTESGNGTYVKVFSNGFNVVNNKAEFTLREGDSYLYCIDRSGDIEGRLTLSPDESKVRLSIGNETSGSFSAVNLEEDKSSISTSAGGFTSALDIVKDGIELSTNNGLDKDNSLILDSKPGASSINLSSKNINLNSGTISISNPDYDIKNSYNPLNFRLISNNSTIGGLNGTFSTLGGSTLNNRISIGWYQTLGLFSNVENVVIIGSNFTADLISDRVYIKNPVIITSATPSSTGDSSGTEGEIRYDSDYIYIKTSGGWKRTGLSTF